MTTASDPITFIVRGQQQTALAATRGRASGSSASFGGRGQTTQRVQVGATRGSSDVVRLTARPGLDAVVLHITNGPSLMLHPETARDLMLAQSGLTRSGVEAQPRSRSGASAASTEINVPAQLGWQGLEQAGASRGASRGRLGDVLLSAVEVVTGLLLEPASRITAAKIAARVDNQVEAGLYPLSAESFATALKGNGQRLTQLAPPTPTDSPLLVLLHGTFSETHGTFGKLWQHHPNKVRELFARYGNRVYGFDHPTLTASPIDNALLLVRSLPKGARLHLLTHSRGGLVAEVLARVCARPDLDEKSLAPFKAPDHRNQLKALRDLAAALKGRDIRVERVVRVACPSRGTLLASQRLDAYVSVLKWSFELAAIPVAPTLIDFIGEVASQRTDPTLMPGLECMMPQSPLVQWLHASEGTDAGPLPGQLRVVAGDIQGDSITSWVKTLLADAFYWTDNDLVVQTRSMYGGTPRAPAGGHAAATFVLERGGKVTHFSYFSEPRSAEAICNALVQDNPAGFQPIGPMSWAGSSSDGLRGMPRSAGAPPASERPAVIMLPGILGSHLAVDGKRVWLSARILGGLGRLAYPDEGGRVLPDGAIGSVYDDLATFLSDTHEVIEFSFDWRRPIEEEAARLADVMDQALAARATSGQPVRLLAHSMGGLVARTAQLERPDVWQRWLERPGSRMLMLGTPNGGSFAPMQVLSGDDTMGNALSAFGMPFQDHKARRLMAAMPGFLQLQAGLLDPALGLAQSERWQALATQDMKTLEDANFWHSVESQRAIYRWGVPSQEVLDRAVALRRRLDQQRDAALPGFRDRLLMVVGHARFTPASFEIDAREGLVYLDQPDGGDGRVTLESALLPGVRAWKVDCEHGGLPDAASAFAAYLELLQHGDTQRLPLVGALPLARSGGGAVPALVRSRPSRQRSTVMQPPTGLGDVLALAAEAPIRTEAPQSALRISVHNANLKFISSPLLVGHYFSSTLSGSEAVVDRFIGGVMSASLAAGLYPEAPGTHQIFVNNRQDPDSPLSLPRPPHVVVAGLGSEGKLKSAAITHTVRQATLAWAQRVAEAPDGGATQFELAATMIGSGGSGISVSTSAQAVAQGVREANEKLSAGGWPVVSHLRLVELYLDRATEAWGALTLLCAASPDHFVLSPCVVSGVGALRRTLDNGYRGTAYDFISAVTVTDETGEPSIVYTLDTQRARAEVRAQATQARLVGELVRRASNDANRDRNIGRTLFQLLVPVEMESSLSGTSELLLELDDGTAAIPWELLDAPDDGRGGPEAPWAIRNKLLRRLRTVAFRTQVSDARLEDCVLVIGEPLSDPALYPPLPAARVEAEAVVEALSGQLGLDASRVHALIAPDDGLGPDAAAVTTALLARRYRIVHIAGHGEPELLRPGKPPLLRGVVLSDNTFLGPREVQAMRVVPELVFLNCCHLAADPDKLLKGGYDRAQFAAGVAKQLIRIGVRCVVAAGWAVEDDAANLFATEFYRALLSGQRFMDAVQAGRVAAYNANPQGNTWAAYQCYGDPDWVWQRNETDTRRTPPPLSKLYAGIASPVALALALETLAVQSATQGAAPESQREKIRYLEARFDSEWGGMGAVAEAFGVAWAAARDIERALHWYRRAVAANDSSASVKANEQLANLGARQAWTRLEAAGRNGSRPAALKALVEQGRKEIGQAIAILDALVTLSPTVERESLLGSTWKRMARLEGMAGASAAAAKAHAIDRMAEHYRRAEALALQGGQADLFYPALNLVAAELLSRGRDRQWAGFGAERLQRVRQSLELKQREDPDFWSVVGIPELSVYEALASHALEAQLPNILTSFDDMHQRAGTAWMWASVADQLGFVLAHLEGVTRADRQAADELLSVLNRYAAE
ncbi:CHAT domain-containing protein [Hydrogenophaga sp. PBL-H3]|uniref:CHAT domain-containing protein n=1 Tax=Hydrogenophaga sp. PBL-H3 TaxID=434010 RepID=UPI00131F872F|nr:CHAT domain-containing protein [Hydrogenophaga sp. PBL-H3]QHE76223.1 CHAT domain-containing protein [Hydrogenophaga sp. PBL-H3]QHE80647.1 CHAT domain-containing protein [Hydrogenophaga sp. PBL-H3]